MTVQFAARLIIFASILTTLAACPVPLPRGDTWESRQNIGDKVPDFIVPGKTARTDVLLALGEPDVTSENGMQFTYTRITSEGGVLFVMAAGGGAAGAGSETMTYRHLVILFDEAGVVTSARNERVSCSETLFGAGNSSYRSPPCSKPP
ncbi:MAG: hypothetical protein Q8K18_12555 [Burkholderiales bacterium]|nr:hypothetical protein [Burkholderiales bacterium]